MEKSRMKSYMLLILFAAALAVIVFNFEESVRSVWSLVAHLRPVLIACIIAFVLNVPMTAIGNRLRRLFRNKRRQPSDALIGGLSLLITALLLLLIVNLVGTMVIPQLIQSVTNIVNTVVEKFPLFLDYLNSLNLDTSVVEDFLAELDLNNLLNKITSNAGNMLNAVMGTASSTIGSIATFGLALVISIYFSINKNTLSRQAKALAYANLSPHRADRLCYIASLTSRTYSKFLSGQCIEAVVLGLLLAVALSIFRIPYAGVIASTTAVMSFVPYIGAFLSCALGALFVLMVDPFKALLCIIVFQCVQFIEGQFIYPKVVGNSVGLPSMWTLIAVMLGGQMFGLLGMLFFIPLAAVLYTLITENTTRKLKEKNIDLSF